MPAPPSKSYTHRALLAGFLAGRRYAVRNPNVGDDTLATLNGLEGLGAEVVRGTTRWEIDASGHRIPRSPPRVDCNSSGSTLRFLTALAATRATTVRFSGSNELAGRPIGGLLDSLARAGAHLEGPPRGRSLPFTISGPVRPGSFRTPVDLTSQYLSSMLMVLPTLPGESVVRPVGRSVSAPYIEATLAVLQAHRVDVVRSPGSYVVPGNQEYSGRVFEVPGDASSAAYLWSAAAVTGGEVTVTRWNDRWPQGDRRILELLDAAGARVRRSSHAVRVRGPIERGFRIDLTDAPDLLPLAGVIGALAPKGRTELLGAAHARFKESNRRRETCRLARAFSARVHASGRAIRIEPGGPPSRVRLRGPADHRLVMSGAVGALALRAPSEISYARSVGKSFPEFWRSLQRLGSEVRFGP